MNLSLQPKILHITRDTDPRKGGISQALRTLIAGLMKLGVWNEVASLDNPENDYNVSFPVHRLGPAKGLWGYSSKFTPWLLENITGFDVIILHGIWLYQDYALYRTLLSTLQSNLKAPKFFIMPHGMLDPYFQLAGDRKLKAVRNWIYWHILEKKIVNAADGLLFTCEKERALAHKTFHDYNPKKQFVVGLDVNAPPSYSVQMKKAFLEKCPRVYSDPYFLFLGRIHPKKGVDLLIKAYNEILRRLNYDSTQIPKLVIAGPGADSHYGKEMLKLVSDNPLLSDSIFFPGMLSGDAKWGAIHGCDAFLLPSHQENFGIAVVEALGCATPVLISDQVNISADIVSLGGAVVAPDTLQGTITLLQTWLSISPKIKDQMREAALKTFNEKFENGLGCERFLEAVIGCK